LHDSWVLFPPDSTDVQPCKLFQLAVTISDAKLCSGQQKFIPINVKVGRICLSTVYRASIRRCGAPSAVTSTKKRLKFTVLDRAVNNAG
jgi:hypothetical protein